MQVLLNCNLAGVFFLFHYTNSMVNWPQFDINPCAYQSYTIRHTFDSNLPDRAQLLQP